MKNKNLLLIGGAGILGVIVLYVLSKERATPSVNAPPSSVGSLDVPTYPVAPISTPPINITETPYQNSYNVPQSRQMIPQNVVGDKGDCACHSCDASGIGAGATLSPAIAAQVAAKQRRILYFSAV